MLDVKMDMEEVRHKVEQSDVCKCSELKLRCERAEEKCEELKLKIQVKNIECELLQDQMKKLKSEKSAIEEELKVWMEKSQEPGNKICFEDGKKGVVNVIDKKAMEELVQLLIENKVLAVEKKKAESEAEMWKDKFTKFEIQISKMDERKGDEPELSGRFEGGIGSSLSPKARALDGVASNRNSLSKETRDLEAGTPPNGSPHNHTVSFGRGKELHSVESYFKDNNQVRKPLNFEEESPRKKMTPLTPTVSKPLHDIINIDASDDELTIAILPSHNQKKSEAFVSAAQVLSGSGSICFDEKIGKQKKLRELHCGTKNVENMEAFSDDKSSTPKRKRASNIITSSTETDGDDNIPIGKLKRLPLQKTKCTQVSLELNNSPATASTSACDEVVVSGSPARRRLVSLRNFSEIGSGEKNSSNQITEIKNGMKDVEDGDGLEDVGSELESESDSLEGFIVDSSDDSDVGSASHSEDLSNSSEGYDEIISKLGRRKKELKWEYEADMLAAFGKDAELCMKAVCALYRQQTSEEKVSKESLFPNKRGFSKFDATKGTRLAEFLIDGDPQGNIKKSVRELEEYDPNAIDVCRKLATHYSKQLFEIYGNKEDPFFLPA